MKIKTRFIRFYFAFRSICTIFARNASADKRLALETKQMWKEKLGNYLIDVSKYFLTGVFVASLIKDLEDMRWLIYALSGTIAAALLVSGLILVNKKEKK